MLTIACSNLIGSKNNEGGPTILYVNNIQNVSVHRTCTPLIEQYVSTPYPTFLDPNETANIYSGMCMARTGADTVALIDGATGNNARVFGLSALDRNPNIDDYTQTGNNSWTVWIGGVNSVFTLDAPAFDTTATYTVPTNGSRQYLYPISSPTGTQLLGQLTSVQGATNTAGYIPVAELLDVLGPTSLVVRLIPVGSGL